MKTAVSLNPKQIELIKFIAKYRFVTASQVQKHFNLKSRPSVNVKLKVLVTAGLVGMQYDRSYKLIGKPAAFFLTPKGMREAQKHVPYITEALIRSSYSDKKASESLVQESAKILELSASITNSYPGMKALTARQLADIDYLPKLHPSLYLAQNTDSGPLRYFLYYFGNTKRYDVAVNSKIARLVKYRESETYAQSGNSFPTVLLVCDSAAIERLAQRSMRGALNRSYESINAYTTSYQSLLGQTRQDEPLWSSIDDPDTLVSFGDIEADL